MAEETGIVKIGVGPDQDNIRWFMSMTTDQANNASGSSGTHLVDFSKFPATVSALSQGGEVPINTGPGPHRRPGESLYLGLSADAADALVSANETIEIHEVIRDARGGERHVTHTAANNNTDTLNGGVADNPTTVVGQTIPVAAWKPLNPGEMGKLYGFFRYVSADA